jgi:hypothetical protein
VRLDPRVVNVQPDGSVLRGTQLVEYTMPGKDTRYSELRMRSGDYDKAFDETDTRRRDSLDSGEDHIVCNINPSSCHPARIQA